MTGRLRTGLGRGALNLLYVGFLLVAQSTVASQEQPTLHDSWELRVCADPNSLPFSNRSEEGFENRIAEVLSESLGADLTYDWWPQGSTMISIRLREGECDLVMGVPDGHSELLTTIAYYRSPFVFVYRADSPFQITSLDDPLLASLTIGVQGTGITPHLALLKRGLAGNVTSRFGRRANGSSSLSPIVDAVADGTVDVGLAWGPVAGYYAKRARTALTVVPVSPEFDPPSLSMVTSMTIGVRPGDEALRDRLNRALAESWPEIQDILHDYSVPLRSLPRPTMSAEPAVERLRVGLVAPTRTGSDMVNASVYDIVGEAARMGALLAESDTGRVEDAALPHLELLTASSPSSAAAWRAADRLIEADTVQALIGGLGAGQSEALSALAEQHEIPFFNIGSASPTLRAACRRYTFHVEAGARMYLDALVRWYSRLGHRRWFLVYEESEEGLVLRSLAKAAVEEQGVAGRVVGVGSVVSGQPYYGETFEAIRSAGTDAVLLLVDAVDQISFLAQQSASLGDVAVATFPAAITQTRNYLAAAEYAVGSPSHRHRVLLWETTLGTYEPDHLNTRFIARWGQPMDPTAWAAYFSLTAIHESARRAAAAAVREGGGESRRNTALSEQISDQLSNPEAVFGSAKGKLRFRPGDQQLLQPLYGVELVDNAGWGLKVSRQLAVAQLVTELSADDPRSSSPPPALPCRDPVD